MAVGISKKIESFEDLVQSPPPHLELSVSNGPIDEAPIDQLYDVDFSRRGAFISIMLRGRTEASACERT